MAGRKWTLEETKMAFALYMLLEHREINKRNPNVINLAASIDRTPASVYLKLENIASHDANRVELGRVGMQHSNKLDKQIWAEYKSRGDGLLIESLDLLSEALKEGHLTCPTYESIAMEFETLPEGKEKTVQIQQRVNQRYFRNTLINIYNGRCCITGLASPSLLVASHIKPWKICDPKTERLAASNGLLLNALHDRAFDQGYLTVDTNYMVHISSRIKKNDDPLSWLWGFDGKAIHLPKSHVPDPKLLEYHNDVLFLH